MCRNITPLRGLEPAATDTEIAAAALQYARKVAAISAPSATTQAALDRAVERIAAATKDLLAELPERRNPPAVLPPLRRRGVVGPAAPGRARPRTPGAR
ncbi:MAG TPA: DUF2277 domain-containing protein [Mycobacteriales bacterium]|nr:DUF2277 domain-containing protein [Mycobacteriales bacterium]